jgi:NAD-dependent deacetylase
MPPSRRRQRVSRSASPSSSSDDGASRPHQRRRSSRGNHSLSELAKDICLYRKRVLFITGAGISVASGVRPFRGSSGVWTSTIWTNATRDAFRKDPLKWYNEFWLPNLSLPQNAKPNAAHHALHEILQRYPSTLSTITQNVDGLHPPSKRLIEAHGKLGLFKCMPDEDSDTDSDDDDDDERLVHLGHRRKRRLAMKKQACRYQQQESLTVDQVEPAGIRCTLDSGRGNISEPPKCPSCQNALAPQALLFDEGYHSHDFYQFQQMEEWLANAETIVFVGTSFAVRLPEIALEHARAEQIPVYNFNTQDMLEATTRLNATNLRGPSEKLLPLLLQEIRELELTLGIVPPMAEQEQEVSTEPIAVNKDTGVTATPLVCSPRTLAGTILVKS